MLLEPCNPNRRSSLTIVTFALIGCIIICCFQESPAIAIAPSTFGTAIARAGKFSNTLKVSGNSYVNFLKPIIFFYH